MQDSKYWWASGFGSLIGKEFHWTHSRQGRLLLHRGSGDKCRRIHLNAYGEKASA